MKLRTAAAGFLVALTIFLSGEQNERTGVAHLPAILWLLAAVVWLLRPIVFRQAIPTLRFSRIDGCVYGFFGLVFVSIFWSLLPGHGGAPRANCNMLSAWIVLATAWFLFRQTFHDPRLVTALLAVVTSVVFAESLVGLHQQFVEFPRLLRQAETDPVGTVAAADPTLEPETPAWYLMLARIRTSAPMGTYPMSNTLGGLLACWLIFPVGAQLFSPRDRFSLRDSGGMLLIVLTTLCFVLTKCRSGYVALSVGIVLLAATVLRRSTFSTRFKRPVVWCGAGLVLAAILIGAWSFRPAAERPAFGKGVSAGIRLSLGFRLEYWEASLGMIRDMPWLGCGSGNFKATYTKYKLPRSSEEISDPHNFAVELAAVAGLPTLILFVVPIAVLIVRGFRPETSSTARAAPSAERDVENNDRLETSCFWGGLGGCWGAFFLSFGSEVPMDAIAPLAATCAFPVVAWSCRGTRHVPSCLFSISAIVLLVHLSAAGGISVTNTSILLWLLAAATASRWERRLPASDHSSDHSSDHEASLSFDRTWRIGLALMLICCIGAVNHFGVRPVFGSFFLSSRAESERDPLRRIALLRQAVAKDPWSALLQECLATESFRCWIGAPQNVSWKNATCSAQNEALRLAPRSAVLRFVFAERMNLISQNTGDGKLRETALELYRAAIDRYPNHAGFRASYALLLGKVGRSDEALRQRDAALELDDVMPHADKKLPPEIRAELMKMGDSVQ